MARSIRKRVEEGAERPCISIGDPFEEARRVVHIFVGCDVRDRSRTHTLELYYPSVSLLFSRSPFFFLFFLILLSILVRWYRVIRAPLYPLTVSQPTVFSRILVFRVESSRENDYQSGRVSHRVKFYRRNICPGDRFITGANASRESSRVESSEKISCHGDRTSVLRRENNAKILIIEFGSLLSNSKILTRETLLFQSVTSCCPLNRYH